MNSNCIAGKRNLAGYHLENAMASIWVGSIASELDGGFIVSFIYDNNATQAIINDDIVKSLGISMQELKWTLKAIADDPYGQLLKKEVKPEGFSVCQDLIINSVFDGKEKIAEADALAQGLLLLEWLSKKETEL